MVNKAKINELISLTVILSGLAATGFSIYQFPLEKVDAGLGVFVLSALFFSSYLQIQIPRTKSYFTISDALVFFALMHYGGEIAVVLAALESLFSSLNLRRKSIAVKTRTLLLNIAIAAVTTSATVYILRLSFGSIAQTAEHSDLTTFVKLLCAMAIVQFLFNSLFVSVFTALRDNKPIWKNWHENFTNALLIYIAGAMSAGFLVKAIYWIEPFLILAGIGFLSLFQITYRRYFNDIRQTAEQAEQAERARAEQAENHIVELRHHIVEQEKISEALRESKERFRHAAYHDTLTDLPNRTLFLEKLNLLLDKSKRDSNVKFAVLFLDLNRFKTVNDSLGHSAGDRLLLNVAKRLSGLTREGDLVARFNGDEFAIILNNLTATEDAVRFAETIRQRLLTAFTISGRLIFTSVSIGIAPSQPYYEQAEDILRDADIAMYHAKECGRDHVVFDQTMHTRAVTLLQLETDLRHAVERSEMLAYYQPIIDLATMRLMGFEALMRWNHPTRGIVPPNEFIPVAEDTNFIVPLTTWMLKKSCAQLAEWQHRSPHNKSLVMSVNLSGKHFAHGDIVEQIQQIIVKTQISPECLKLEITESAMMDNPEKAIATLKRLKNLGAQVSIDDFGTGYSSLSYLHRFPIDTLKVDRSFVSTMENGTENGEIVRTIISLAKTLNLSVIAEGIESIHQLHQLRILGCEYGQGYLFSRPVPAEEAQSIIDDQSRWQNIIPNNNPAILAQNREYTHLRLMSN